VSLTSSADSNKNTLLDECKKEYESLLASGTAQDDIFVALSEKYSGLLPVIDASNFPEFQSWLDSSRLLCLPCEGIGSVPRPPEGASEQAVIDTFKKLLEATGGDPNMPLTDGEQTKPSFVSYPIAGIATLNPNGVILPFVDGHTRQLPAITEGPFKYSNYAVEYLRKLKQIAPPGQKLKQAVIAASAMCLLYPAEELPGYSKDEFCKDVVGECVKDIRQCLDEGADVVQMDFTEGRLSLKLDPSGGLLKQLLSINEMVISCFSPEEKQRIGIHVCPGADQDATHSADVEYELLLPELFRTLSCGRFYLQMKSEQDHHKVLECIKASISPHQKIFIGCTDVNNPRIETAEEVCNFIQDAAMYIPVGQLGVCDDCGFSPFADDVSTSREIAFAKMKARVDGCRKASRLLLKK
jgi:5-methyltetrahydropteroyltriglutamate--homocysteine methyltransferase